MDPFWRSFKNRLAEYSPDIDFVLSNTFCILDIIYVYVRTFALTRRLGVDTLAEI